MDVDVPEVDKGTTEDTPEPSTEEPIEENNLPSTESTKDSTMENNSESREATTDAHSNKNADDEEVVTNGDTAERENEVLLNQDDNAVDNIREVSDEDIAEEGQENSEVEKSTEQMETEEQEVEKDTNEEHGNEIAEVNEEASENLADKTDNRDKTGEDEDISLSLEPEVSVNEEGEFSEEQEITQVDEVIEIDEEKADDSQSNDNQLDIDPFAGDSNQASENMEVDEENTASRETTEEKDKDKDKVAESDDEILVEKVVSTSKDKETSKKSSEAQKEDGTESARSPDISPDLVIDAGDDESSNKAKEKEKSKGAPAKKKATIKVANLSNNFVNDIIDLEDEGSATGRKNKDASSVASSKCKQCSKEKPCPLKVKLATDTFAVCSQECKTAYEAANHKAVDIPSEGVNSKREKRCAFCLLIVEPKDERNLSWETMEFCNEECLGKFQNKYGSYCRNCNGPVQPVSLGKYCVRFGYDVRQFCCSTCLEEFKKGLKVCSYCQKDISAGAEGFLAPVGDKGQFKDFCTQDCMEKYTKMNSTEPPAQEKKVCVVCHEEKLIHCEVQIDRNPEVAVCSEICFAAFKFVNKVEPEQCTTCKKYFQNPTKKGFVVFYEDDAHCFCNKTCLNVFIITNRKIVPCNWCKVKKYNFDMIRKDLKTGQVIMMCSLNCLTLYQVSINAVSARRINCDFCKEFTSAQYHLTMSDATIRNFCSYNCVMNFQAQYTRSPITIPTSDDPVPTGVPKRSVPTNFPTKQIQPTPTESLLPKKTVPVISSVGSLAVNGQPSIATQAKTVQQLQAQGIHPIATPMQASVGSQTVYKQQVITRPPTPPTIANKVTQCRPQTHTKGVSCRPIHLTKETQTDEETKCILPLPVPIYVPFPVHMYSMPYPVPVPIPIPIPVPVFIPTTRNSAKGIFKEIKRIQEKLPSDPFEAELLMMAEMAEIATDKKAEQTDTDSDSGDDNRDAPVIETNNATNDFGPDEAVDSSNTFGDDMLQMALKMATGEIEEPAVDLEAALTPSTIQAPPPQSSPPMENNIPDRIPCPRGRKRGMGNTRGRGGLGGMGAKRGRRLGINDVSNIMESPEPPQQPKYMEPAEKPDANMALKYTFGVNAWRQWVITKNTELEKNNGSRKIKLFKTDLLQLTADELNYTLCMFVKEVRKPNGTEYAPDTIYYLCLGIQQYLFENNRIDNIFTDAYYEKFTDCLNEVAVKFSAIYTDAQFIVTRVEEEHLWECKQLGAHSPHVLLNTLMFFSTKHFNLTNVDEHMQLSFSHIMKHWKRSANNLTPMSGKPTGTKNVILRFYPPHNALDNNPRKKKVYEQQENEENPLRCPVKLYEFYLSKCPESVKTRNDVFYLLPERSCVPDSPVWYSTSPLGKDHLVKMINRIKMVKEINVALLQS